MDRHLLRPISKIKFGIREATAFVAHSFSSEDREVVERVIQFLTKLGLVCETGRAAEPRSISDKVLARLQANEVFVGIFTRKGEKNNDGGYSTSAWLIEEKTAAINNGNKMLLFVEEGVENNIGGLQGDCEHIRFNRSDLADALIRSMDYVLAITSIELSCEVNYATNSINIKLGEPNVSLDGEVKLFLARHKSQPDNQLLLGQLADIMLKNNQKIEAISLLQAYVRRLPHVATIQHKLGHFYEADGQIDNALVSYQSSLDRDSNNYEFNRCYGKCLYTKTKLILDPVARRATLEKSKRLLQRAANLGGPAKSKEVESDLFVVQEALSDVNNELAGKKDAAIPVKKSPKIAPKSKRNRKK